MEDVESEQSNDTGEDDEDFEEGQLESDEEEILAWGEAELDFGSEEQS